MHTTVTFHNAYGMDSDRARTHDGHRVALLDYVKIDPDADGLMLEVGCHDCAPWGMPSTFLAYPEELMLTTDRMPCTDFVYVGSDDEDGPYSRCGTHPWEPELMGTPSELNIMGWCEGWRGIPYAELTMHDEVLRRFRAAKNYPTKKEN